MTRLKPHEKVEVGVDRARKRGKITDFFVSTVHLKTGMENGRRSVVEEGAKAENDEKTSGGGSSGTPVLTWKQQLLLKPAKGTKLNPKNKFKKGKPKLRGAKSRIGRGRGRLIPVNFL